MSKIQPILDKLGQLSPDELKEVENKLSVLKSLKPPSNYDDKNDTELQLFYTTINKRLTALTGYPELDITFFKKSGGYKKLKEAFIFINAFLENALKRQPSRREKQVGYLLFANLVMENEKNHPGVPLSMMLVLNTYHNFPGLVERAFPGYVRSGLGNYIFSPIQNPKDLDKLL